MLKKVYKKMLMAKLKHAKDEISHLTIAKMWAFLLVVFILAIVLTLLLHFYFFYSISRETLFSSSESVDLGAGTVDRKSLTDIVDFLNVRDGEFSELKLNAPSTIDPSP